MTTHTLAQYKREQALIKARSKALTRLKVRYPGAYRTLFLEERRKENRVVGRTDRILIVHEKIARDRARVRALTSLKSKYPGVFATFYDEELAKENLRRGSHGGAR